MSTSDNFGINLLTLNQLNKDISVNEAINIISYIAQIVLATATAQVTTPINPAIGYTVMVGLNATGNFAGEDGNIAIYTSGGWRFAIPKDGMVVWISDSKKLQVLNGGVFQDLASFDTSVLVTKMRDLSDVDLTGLANFNILQYNNGKFTTTSTLQNIAVQNVAIQNSGIQNSTIQGTSIGGGTMQNTVIQTVDIQNSTLKNVAIQNSGVQNSTMIGINTTADSSNLFAAKTDNALFTSNTGSCQIKLNKNATANTSSILFQSGYSGRAEFGIIGEDNISLKTSGDGNTWNESFKLTCTTGDVDFKKNLTKNGVKIMTFGNNYQNFLINGNFDIWQRGTSFTYSGTAKYTADRWLARRSDSTGIVNIYRIAESLVGSQYIMRVARPNADTNSAAIGITQILDPNMVLRLAGQSVTVSALVRLSTSFLGQKVSMQLFSSTSTTQTANPFAFTTSSVLEGSSDITTKNYTWVKLSITASLNVNIKSLMVSFVSNTYTGTAGTNDFLDIAQVKVEIGGDATPFIPNDINREQSDCEYYYERLSSSAVNTPLGTFLTANGANTGYGYLLFKRKRRVPSAALLDTAGSNTVLNIFRGAASTTSTAVSFSNIAMDRARLNATAVAALTMSETLVPHFSIATQYVEYDAEIY